VPWFFGDADVLIIAATALTARYVNVGPSVVRLLAKKCLNHNGAPRA